jgi:uroporphyrinogen decarboxylase
MPKGHGLYYDMFHHPLAGNISVEKILKSPAPDPTNPARFSGMRERARKIAQEEKRAVVANQMTAGISEIAAWTRGYENYYLDLIANEKLCEGLLDKILEVKLIYWDQALVELSENVDVLMLGDDFAGQKSLLMSPKTWRKMIKPRYKKLFDFLHGKSRAKIFLHSCGSIREIIPDLIEIGLDIINPVQVSAVNMDTKDLKREYGKALVFWGGGVDSQEILPHGTLAQVHDEVCRRLDDLMPGGGFVFSVVHNIQPDVPTENLMAIYETLCKHGSYST